MEIKEKRLSPRILVKSPLRYQVRGTPEYSNAISDDISVGGIGFVNEHYLKPETPVKFELNILSRALNPVGRIAWSEPLAHSNRYKIGVEFLEFEPVEKTYLSDYINMQLNLTA